jgi:hypothetical protein
MFSASLALVGGLVDYIFINTLVPGLFLRIPPEEYETPEASENPLPLDDVSNNGWMYCDTVKDR